MPSPVNSIPPQYIYQAAAILFSIIVLGGSFVWFCIKKISGWLLPEWQRAMGKLDTIQNNHCAHMEASLASLVQSNTQNTELLQDIKNGQSEVLGSIKTLCDVISKKV